MYKNIPHLNCKIINNNNDVATLTLEGLKEEINNRINILNLTGLKNVSDYNEKNNNKKMQKIVVIIDELNINNSEKFNDCVKEITKIGYKVGIYTIMSLNMDIVNTDIRNLGYSFAYRVSFKVPTSTDSTNILNEKGAEKVKGIGNAMLQTSYNEVITKISVINVPEKDLEHIADIWTKKNERTKK